MPQYDLPFDSSFIERIAQEHPTPFHVYWEPGIRQRVRDLQQAFEWNDGFQQYFAVKATPNPNIVAIMVEEGCGTDCSSVAELVISDRLGLSGHDIMFTSNNTTLDEFHEASKLGSIINLDSPIHIDDIAKLPELPDLISFRYNPGAERRGNVIIGDPQASKFGCTREQLYEGYQRCKEIGIERFGLHAMIVSNELDVESLLDTANMLFKLAVEIHERTGIKVELINLGGGIGVPYRPGQQNVDLQAFGSGVQKLYESILVANDLAPVRILMENGRAMTGPFGYLVTKVINSKQTYKGYVGVDACMSNLMRPGMYGAYHHITAIGKEQVPNSHVCDVVGSLCENNDKFAIDRELPTLDRGDLVLIHDAGAHGHSMGFQYNGRLRSAEFLLSEDGSYRQIRRAETLDDYFATVEFPAPVESRNAVTS
jgi:diaminopimelate decarboxylase